MSILHAHEAPARSLHLTIELGADLGGSVARLDGDVLRVDQAATAADLAVVLGDVARELFGEPTRYARRPRHLAVVR